jgi:hypothetical protein
VAHAGGIILTCVVPRSESEQPGLRGAEVSGGFVQRQSLAFHLHFGDVFF